MKRLLILLALLALCMVPVQAVGISANLSQQTPDGAAWVRNQTVSTQTPDTICDAYDRVPLYPPGDYWYDSVFVFYSQDVYTNMSKANPGDSVTNGDLGVFPPNVNLTWYYDTSYKSVGQYAICNDNLAYVAAMHPWYNNSLYAPPPTANFTAAPLNATAPAYVYFTDLSENETGTCTYNWSFTPSDGVLAAPGDLDNEDTTMLFTQNGNFTISHGVSCAAGSDIETKTDYIHIFNSTALSTLRIRAVDMLSGYGINGAQVDVFDIENSSWTNQTSVTGEVTITALNGHTLNAYGSATGYDDGEILGLPAVHGELYPIYMMPSDTPTNVSEGNLTLYLTVFEYGTNVRLPGMSVSLSGGGGGADFTAGVTNDNGVFQMVIKNQTNYLATIIKQKGYLGGSKGFYSGNQSGGDAHIEVEIWLQKDYVTTAPTVTTLPGGGTPTPQVTYLPHCDPSAADYDEALCRAAKGGVGLNLLADYMDDLILLCIFVTIMYLLGFKLGS